MFPTLKNFKRTEFRAPDQLNDELLWRLDAGRTMAVIPFTIKSDFRSAESNVAAGGAGTSLHLTGRAVDFTIPDWNPASIFTVVDALLIHLDQKGWELELDYSNKHFHLGRFPDDRPSRFVVKGA